MPLNRLDSIMLDLLEEQETLIARLYRVFAEHYDDQRQFWEGLAKDEDNHAVWVRGLRRKVERGHVVINRQAQRLEDLQNFGQKLKKRTETLQKDRLTRVQALKLAHTIERTLIDQPFLRTFSRAGGGKSEVIQDLEKQNKIHAQKIADMLADHNEKPDEVFLEAGARAAIRRDS